MDKNGFIKQLNEIFNHPQQRPYYRYLLVDGLASVSEFSTISLAALHSHFPSSAIVPIKRPDLSYDLAHCPHLVCLAEPENPVDSHYIYRSMQEALSEYDLPRRYVSAWLISEEPPQALAEFIERIGREISVRQGGLFTPFYEPFRLSLFNLDNSLATHWLSAKLKGISHLFYVNAEGQLADAVVDQLSLNNELIYLPDSALFYQQEAKALFYLYDSYQTLLADNNESLPPNAFAKICQYYRQAVNLGINHLADRYIFAFYSMRYGDLSIHQVAMDAVNRALQNPGTLGNYFIEIDEQDWQDWQDWQDNYR